MPPTPINAFDKHSFTGPMRGATRTYDVYRRGEGPPIVVMQELPGIGQETLAFVDRLVGAGFQVWLPHLFGPIGRTSSLNYVRIFCMRREFQLLAKHRSSAITDWLRALCGHVREETGARGVGVVGMCLTGGFALSMIADDAVLAAVASQPSLPPDQRALQMSPEEIAASRQALDGKGAMHAFRFEGDPLCKAERFEAIDAAFNDDAKRVELTVLPGKKHSVFTIHFDAEDPNGPTARALETITAYFHERLDRTPEAAEDVL